MTQTVPATAVLGPGKTGLAIGLRVLDIDRVQYSAFSTTGVAETATLGTYSKAGGAVVPLAGGYIVWGVAGTDYAEATVESTSANVTLWKGDTAPAMTGDSFARLGAPAGASIAADIATISAGGATADELWDEMVDGAYTARQLLRLLASALAGKSTGGGTTGVAFRDLADTKDRITATVDADGNRTSVTLIAT